MVNPPHPIPDHLLVLCFEVTDIADRIHRVLRIQPLVHDRNVRWFEVTSAEQDAVAILRQVLGVHVYHLRTQERQDVGHPSLTSCRRGCNHTTGLLLTNWYIDAGAERHLTPEFPVCRHE